MIICYSGTGNTLHAAERVAEATGERIFRIGFDRVTVCEDGVLGIFLPVFYCRAPHSAEEFIKSLDIKGDPYIYLVATCGGFSADIKGRIHRLLKKKGKRLSATFDLLMPDNYIKLYEISPEAEIKELLEASEKELDDIIQHIASRDTGDMRKHTGAFPHLMSLTVGSMYGPLGRDNSRFRVKDNCTGCKKCVRNCPTGSVIFEDGVLWVDGRCDGCLACINLCPVNAIEIGKLTEGKKRYKHPEYKER